MATNLDRYKKELDELVSAGELLHIAMQWECYPEAIEKELQKQGKKASAFIKILPKVQTEYQSWYSEATAVIRQLLPDRLQDFIRHYEKPKGRKEITYENRRLSSEPDDHERVGNAKGSWSRGCGAAASSANGNLDRGAEAFRKLTV